MKIKNLRRKVFIGLTLCLVIFIVALGSIRLQIQTDLNKWSATAQAAHPHPGDNVASLIDYVSSERHSLEHRNHAVWALGQARQSDALPILEGYFTGEECDHRNYLCQGELDKAIKLCKGETPNLLVIKSP